MVADVDSRDKEVESRKKEGKREIYVKSTMGGNVQKKKE